jgi:hypothetical protein
VTIWEIANDVLPRAFTTIRKMPKSDRATIASEPAAARSAAFEWPWVKRSGTHGFDAGEI